MFFLLLSAFGCRSVTLPDPKCRTGPDIRSIHSPNNLDRLCALLAMKDAKDSDVGLRAALQDPDPVVRRLASKLAFGDRKSIRLRRQYKYESVVAAEKYVKELFASLNQKSELDQYIATNIIIAHGWSGILEVLRHCDALTRSEQLTARYALQEILRFRPEIPSNASIKVCEKLRTKITVNFDGEEFGHAIAKIENVLDVPLKCGEEADLECECRIEFSVVDFEADRCLMWLGRYVMLIPHNIGDAIVFEFDGRQETHDVRVFYQDVRDLKYFDKLPHWGDFLEPLFVQADREFAWQEGGYTFHVDEGILVIRAGFEPPLPEEEIRSSLDRLRVDAFMNVRKNRYRSLHWELEPLSMPN